MVPPRAEGLNVTTHVPWLPAAAGPPGFRVVSPGAAIVKAALSDVTFVMLRIWFASGDVFVMTRFDVAS